MIEIPADQWCEEKLVEYEIAAKNLSTVRDNPKPPEASSAIWSARLKRAQRIYDDKVAFGWIAVGIKELMQTSNKGEITIDLPDHRLKLTWKENT